MRRRRSLRRDRDGVTAVEFAIVAPVMLLLIFGLLDLTFQAYIQSVLDGAVNAAARSGTIEENAADQSAVDQRVADQVHTVVSQARMTFDRTNYVTVSQIGKPELFDDDNKNDEYDPDECFIDYNRNGVWDADRGRIGQGGADDFVRYTATATYQRLFPMAMFGLPATQRLTAVSVLRNQPYAGQGGASNQKVCP